jgi:hypothetical protein
MKNPDSAAIYTMISKSNVKTTTRAKYFLLTLRSRTVSPTKKKKHRRRMIGCTLAFPISFVSLLVFFENLCMLFGRLCFWFG